MLVGSCCFLLLDGGNTIRAQLSGHRLYFDFSSLPAKRPGQPLPIEMMVIDLVITLGRSGLDPDGIDGSCQLKASQDHEAARSRL